MSNTFTIHTDGGSRGNPGPASFAYTIERPGEPDIEEMGYIGDTTNNIAEYAALVKALQHAQELGAKVVLVSSDSELLVQQMNGKYKVKNPGILPLFTEARRIVATFDDFKIRHIYREHNKRTDRLCNEALDDRHNLPLVEILTTRSAATTSAAPAKPVVKSNALRTQAVAVLSEAAQAWSDDEDDAPTPEEVWERLWKLVQAEKSAAKS